MESVQKSILSTTLFLLFIIMGTHGIQAEMIDNNTFSTSFYQQQETPFEKTIHYLGLSGIADLPQPACSFEVSGNTPYKPPFSLHSDSSNLYNTITLPYAACLTWQHACSFTGIEYYIYTLRRILI